MNSPKLIGHAGQLADLLSVTLAGKERHKLLFIGKPGVGKSTVAERVAAQLTGSKFGVEIVNGRHVTIHVVKEWQFDFATSCLFGTGWKVKVVNEIDLCQKDAQDALLSFLDEMPAKRAVIGTSNLELGALTERFRTRFARYEVRPPTDDEIQAMLETDYETPRDIAKQIATFASGNVRAAILDAEAWRNQQPAYVSKPTEYQPTLAALGI